MTRPLVRSVSAVDALVPPDQPETVDLLRSLGFVLIGVDKQGWTWLALS